MVSIIAGTNRKDSNSAIVARQLSAILENNDIACGDLNLKDLPEDFIFHNDSISTSSKELNDLIDRHVQAATHFIFVLAEYNGSYPGILKAFIDCIPTKYFQEKKAILIGLSAGRAGNLLGIDHFSSVLNYLGVHVHPFRLALPHIDNKIDRDKMKIVDSKTLVKLEQVIEKL